jgi:hypothetical protein
MESNSQQNLIADQPADSARPDLAQLHAERDRLVQRLRDLDRTISVLQPPAERADTGNDSLAAQLQRIDQELRAFDGNKSAGIGHSYTGVERRTSPRPTTVAMPLATLSADFAGASQPGGPQALGAVRERTRRMLQSDKGSRV